MTGFKFVRYTCENIQDILINLMHDILYFETLIYTKNYEKTHIL